MDFEKSKKLLFRALIIYLVFVAMIYFVAGDSFRIEAVAGDSLSASATIGELTDGMQVNQRLRLVADSVNAVDVQLTTFGRTNEGILHADVINPDGQVIASGEIQLNTVTDGAITAISLNPSVDNLKGEYVTVVFSTSGCSEVNPISLYYGTSVKAGKFDIVQSIAEEDHFFVDGSQGTGRLCAYFSGFNTMIFYKLYWPLVLGLLAIGIVFTRYWWKQARGGKSNPLVMLCTMITRQGFLMKQLIGRDFKTKYKRSVLGVGWSFLNPLLTMSVQYVVFSTLFGNGTKNYPVYLLSGIVFFNFFNEAVSLGMTSITSNAALIKKVYLNKYVFPVTRVVSSLINLGTSLIPLAIVMLLTQNWPSPALLLLIFDILCLFLFTVGMVLLLSTSMTFFQDTQFLWSVLSMIWMYLTPIFYTETIIPDKFITLFHMNPLYQYITFARICIIDGVSPGPYSYLWCIVSAVIVFAVGALVFRKNQDKFVLHL